MKASLEQAALASRWSGLHDAAPMKLPVRSLIFLFGFVVAELGAQVAGPSPLAPENAADQAVPGPWIVTAQRADRALQNGFPTTAAGLYRELLGDPHLPADTRHQLELSLITAQMDSGDTAAAEEALQNYAGPRNSAYQLRAGLLAITGRQVAAAKTALAGSRLEELATADRGWWYFLQAQIADAEVDFARANNFYEQALDAATSELQHARFLLGQEQALLRRGQLTDQQMTALRGNLDRFQGTRTGYDAARSYATALVALGRTDEAQAVLDRQLAVIPSSERNVADQFRLMLGLIADEHSQTGRQAFRQLLRDAQKPETQRIALQLLVRGAQTPVEREQLRRDLTELIVAPAQNAIIEDLLLVRAQTALADKLYAPAEEDARALIERYPGSSLKASALGVRLAVAWDLKRYRTAADVIVLLRAVLPPGRERAELGVLLAEAFFRAEDYRNAADAYEAALHEAPPAAPAGGVFFTPAALRPHRPRRRRRRRRVG